MTKEPTQTPSHAMIWLHGLGADPQDMMGLVQGLNIDDLPIRHVFMTAPMRAVTINNGFVMPAWYDIRNAEINLREDEQGVLESEKAMLEVVLQLQQQGIDKIFLAGFSQGGAMSLFTGLRMAKPLAGIIALSAYIPLHQQYQDYQQSTKTPIFMASGQYDPIVQHVWSRASAEQLQQAGYEHLSWHSYPMEHAVCPEELSDLAEWIKNQI